MFELLDKLKKAVNERQFARTVAASVRQHTGLEYMSEDVFELIGTLRSVVGDKRPVPAVLKIADAFIGRGGAQAELRTLEERALSLSTSNNMTLLAHYELLPILHRAQKEFAATGEVTAETTALIDRRIQLAGEEVLPRSLRDSLSTGRFLGSLFNGHTPATLT